MLTTAVFSNTTPYTAGTTDGDGSGSSAGVYDGMGMYAGIFKGAILDAMRSNPDIEGVYPDTQGFIAIERETTHVQKSLVRKDVDVPAPAVPVNAVARVLSSLVSAFLGRRAAPGVMREKTNLWNLARLASRAKPEGVNATMHSFNATAGQGVDIYILDTGIFSGHNDFGGRVTWGKSVNSYAGKTTDDNGHGTHLAAIAAGGTYGVAKKANLVAVKVASDAGAAFASDIVTGIHWTIKNTKKSKKPSVISLSLGSGVNGALDAAAEKAVKKGIHFVAAAGNDGGDAGGHSPGRSSKVITVGAFHNADARAAFSNFGTAVDIWAPGTAITSAWLGTPKNAVTLSGTSMAAPHVAGLVAYVISLHGNRSPEEMQKWLRISSTNDTVTKLSGDDRNQMAFNCWSENGSYNFPPPPPTTTTTTMTMTTTTTTTLLTPSINATTTVTTSTTAMSSAITSTITSPTSTPTDATE